MANTKHFIRQEANELIFENLANPQVIYEFVNIINEILKSSEKNLILNFKNVTKAFPNVCVPLSGIIENIIEKGFVFEFYYLSDDLKKVAIKEPLRVSQNKKLAQKHGLDKVWRFDSPDDIYLLIKSFVDELSQIIVCEKGVLDGFEWSINEVLDNVLQHSGKSFGYVMGQVHKDAKQFSFCVYDTGQGIYTSLLNSVHKPQSPSEALQLAVQEGITRDKKIGQGNGLWGLHQIVSENTGQLNITSNSACYHLINNQSKVDDKIPQLPFDNGCIVDFQIDYNKEISISKALVGYAPPVNLKIEALEDNAGNITIDLSEQTSGVGTRKSGEKIRNELINIYKQTNKSITLDFSNINIVSSSFADELIGKLVAEFGFYGFTNIFKLKNMNVTVQSIVQRSVGQRMVESFN
ncbi:hypothetical protein FACS1894156_5490 [Bacteroidia bacterium]|nr:hypothetical protein FACS1894156_5490 [Bacteroidia bacterium]